MTTEYVMMNKPLLLHCYGVGKNVDHAFGDISLIILFCVLQWVCIGKSVDYVSV